MTGILKCIANNFSQISELKQFNEGLAKEKGDLRQELEQQNKKVPENFSYSIFKFFRFRKRETSRKK